jgi:hypothetical protein
LEDEGGGYLVDEGLVFLAGFSGCVEDFMGSPGGQALVPEMDGEVRHCGQLLDEGFVLGGLSAGLAGHVERVAGDDGYDVEFAAEAGEGAEVVFGIALAGERQDGLGGQAEFVGDGYADALGAYVEAEVARDGIGFDGIPRMQTLDYGLGDAGNSRFPGGMTTRKARATTNTDRAGKKEIQDGPADRILRREST